MNETRLYLVSTGSHEGLIVEADSDKEAVKKYLKANGLPLGETFIVRYVSDVVGTYRVEVQETSPQPSPTFTGDAIS